MPLPAHSARRMAFAIVTVRPGWLARRTVVTTLFLVVALLTPGRAHAQTLTLLGPPQSYSVDWTVTAAGYSYAGPAANGGIETDTVTVTGMLAGSMRVEAGRLQAFSMSGGLSFLRLLERRADCAGGGDSTYHHEQRSTVRVTPETVAGVTMFVEQQGWSPVLLYRQNGENRFVGFNPPLVGDAFYHWSEGFSVTVNCDGESVAEPPHSAFGPGPWSLGGAVSPVPLAGPIPVTQLVSEAQPAAERRITITVAATITILEDAACRYLLSPTGVVIGRGGGTAVIHVSASSPGCTWIASSAPGIVSSLRPSAGSGNRPVTIEVGANPSPSPRWGSVTIAGEAVPIAQAGGIWSWPSTDVNLDGRVDLLWQHADGRLATWLMSGVTQIAGVALVPPAVADRGWRVAGVGDLDGDRLYDLVWQHAWDGRVSAWRMAGLNQVEGALLSEPRVADLNWRIGSVGDFNGDGRADLVWQHQADGRLAVWIIDGFQVVFGSLLYAEELPDVTWQLAGSGDFNGDGHRDLVFQHGSHGGIRVCLMNGTQLVGAAAIVYPGQVDAGWKIRGVGDLDNDGHPDLLWQHVTDGSVSAWLMDGLHIRAGTRLSPPVVADLGWKIVGPK